MSKVRSLNLDVWEPEQAKVLCKKYIIVFSKVYSDAWCTVAT